MIKKEHIKHLKEMNTEAEKVVKSLQQEHSTLFWYWRLRPTKTMLVFTPVEVVLDAYRLRPPEAVRHHVAGAGTAQ